MIADPLRVHETTDMCGGYGCGCLDGHVHSGHQPPADPFGGFDLASECTGEWHPHCVDQLARGHTSFYALCPACTRLVVDAVDAVLPGLVWSPRFAEADS